MKDWSGERGGLSGGGEACQGAGRLVRRAGGGGARQAGGEACQGAWRLFGPAGRLVGRAGVKGQRARWMSRVQWSKHGLWRRRRRGLQMYGLTFGE